MAFSLRANPVITLTDTEGRARRNDLVMDIKKQTGWQEASPSNRPALAELIQQAGEQWLLNRQENIGVRVDNLVAYGFRRRQSFKRKKKNPIRCSTLDLQGMLTMTDREKLLATLIHGVGPAKVFGCGLLLVRRL